MQTVLYIAATIAVLVIAGAIVMLVTGVLKEVRRIGQAAETLDHLLRVTEEELAETTRTARTTLNDVDQLIVDAGKTVGRVDNVASGVERLLQIVHLASGGKVGKSPAGGLISVYEGIKQGIRTLWG